MIVQNDRASGEGELANKINNRTASYEHRTERILGQIK